MKEIKDASENKNDPCYKELRYMQPTNNNEGKCPFCDIKKIASAVVETEGCYIFEPLNPVVKGHRLVVPVFHVNDFTEDKEISANVMRVASDWAYNLGGDFNIITSKGKNATQSVFHMHVHLIPRKENDGLLLPWSNQSTPPTKTESFISSLRKNLLMMIEKYPSTVMDCLDSAYLAGLDEAHLSERERVVEEIKKELPPEIDHYIVMSGKDTNNWYRNEILRILQTLTPHKEG